MPEQSGEDLRERRRRQNRESQQRWRRRHKKSHSNQSRPSICAGDDVSSTASLLSPLSSMQSGFITEPRGIGDRVDYRTSWIHKQSPAATHASESLPLEPWHMGFTPTGGPQSNCVGASHSQSEALTNRPIETYNNGHSYIQHDASGGYSTSSGAFSSLELGMIKGNGDEHRDLPRSLSETIHTPGGDHHPLNVQDNDAHRFPPMLTAESESLAKETASPAENAINEVQELYSIGVKAGFLQRDDKVQEYLAVMKRIYHRAPYLRDGECQGCCCYSE